MTEESLPQSHSETELCGSNELSESKSRYASESEPRSDNNKAAPKPQRKPRALQTSERASSAQEDQMKELRLNLESTFSSFEKRCFSS